MYMEKKKIKRKSESNKRKGKVVEISLGKIFIKLILVTVLILGTIWLWNRKYKVNSNQDLKNTIEYSNNNVEFQDLNIKDENDVFKLYSKKYVGIWPKYYLDHDMPDYELNIKEINDREVSFDFNCYRIADFNDQKATLEGNVAKFETVTNYDSSNWKIKGTITFNEDKINLKIINSEFEDLIPPSEIDFLLKTDKSKLK